MPCIYSVKCAPFQSATGRPMPPEGLAQVITPQDQDQGPTQHYAVSAERSICHGRTAAATTAAAREPIGQGGASVASGAVVEGTGANPEVSVPPAGTVMVVRKPRPSYVVMTCGCSAPEEPPGEEGEADVPSNEDEGRGLWGLTVSALHQLRGRGGGGIQERQKKGFRGTYLQRSSWQGPFCQSRS